MSRMTPVIVCSNPPNRIITQDEGGGRLYLTSSLQQTDGRFLLTCKKDTLLFFSFRPGLDSCCFSLLEVFLFLLCLRGDPMLFFCFFFVSFGAAESVSFPAAAEDALTLLLVRWRC